MDGYFGEYKLIFNETTCFSSWNDVPQSEAHEAQWGTKWGTKWDLTERNRRDDLNNMNEYTNDWRNEIEILKME